MNNTTLAEVLRGCVPGKIQTVGAMQIIPLLADSIDAFALPGTVSVGTTNYGTLVFSMQGDDSRPALIPKDSMYLTKKGSQDHSLSKVVIIGPGERQSHNDAACVQASQGGTMPQQQRELLLLPMPLREAAHRVRDKKQYGKLWNSISEFNSHIGIRGDTGHISVFVKQYREQLDQFVAEFEPVPLQVGAIFLVGGNVAGVERFPSYEYWGQVWSTIVRECYGSYALLAQKHGMFDSVPGTRVPLAEGAETVDELYDNLLTAQADEMEAASGVVRALLAEPLDITDEWKGAGGWLVDTLESTQFVGQAVRDSSGLVLYASVVATKQRLSAPYGATKTFTI